MSTIQLLDNFVSFARLRQVATNQDSLMGNEGSSSGGGGGNNGGGQSWGASPGYSVPGESHAERCGNATTWTSHTGSNSQTSTSSAYSGGYSGGGDGSWGQTPANPSWGQTSASSYNAKQEAACREAQMKADAKCLNVGDSPLSGTVNNGYAAGMDMINQGIACSRAQAEADRICNVQR